GNRQAVGYVVRGRVVRGHRRGRCPGKVVVEHLAEARIGDASVRHCVIEARDGAAVHLLVQPIAAVQPDYQRLVAILLAVRPRTAPRLDPVRGQPLGVPGMKAVTERMSDDLIREYALMPCVRQSKYAVSTTGGFEYR